MMEEEDGLGERRNKGRERGKGRQRRREVAGGRKGRRRQGEEKDDEG